MALKYTPPDFVKPQDYSGIPRSIDQLFSAFQQARQNTIQNAQVGSQLQTHQLSNLASRAQLASSGVNPSGDVAAQLDELVARHKASIPFQMRELAAKANTAEADSAMKMIEAGMLGWQPGQGGLMPSGTSQAAPGQAQGQAAPQASGGNLITNTVDQVQAGKMSPETANTIMSRNPAMHLAYLNELTKRGVDTNKLIAQQAGNVAAAQSKENGPITQSKMNAKSLLKSLDVYDKIQKDFPRGQLQPLNDLKIEAARKTGNRAAQRLITQAETIAEQYQNAFGGSGGSDAKLALAKRVLDGEQTIGQLSDSIKILRADTMNKVHAYNGSDETVHPDFGDAVQKIKVSNGKETFLIDPADEADAAKDGYRRAK